MAVMLVCPFANGKSKVRYLSSFSQCLLAGGILVGGVTNGRGSNPVGRLP